MAGDWIWIEADLPQQRKVMAIGRRCGMNAFEAVGRLVAFWGWVTGQPIEVLEDGERGAVVDVDVDALVGAGVGAREFFEAMISEGWLEVGEVGGAPAIIIPRYNSWLSKSAKGRLQKSLRQRAWRQGKANVGAPVGAPVDGGVDGKGGKGKRGEVKAKEGRAVKPAVDLDKITYPKGMDTPEVRESILEWCQYKRSKGETYKQPATQIGKLLKEAWVTSPAAFVAAVDRSIARNYAGCFPEKGSGNGNQTRVGPGQRHPDDADRKEF